MIPNWWLQRLTCNQYWEFLLAPRNTKEAYCFTWLETEGRRGNNKIGSCIYYFVHKMIKKSTQQFENCATNKPLILVIFWKLSFTCSMIEQLDVVVDKFASHP
uniref:Uncharacterized protein n=1 Tax=Romanomermis culicivorax TaxID=13658 RepID=A0A915KLD9_ROMCU